MTISNKIKQNTEELTLSARQTKAIPILVACSTYTEGCKKAKVNRTTLYEWLSNPAFRAELEKQQKAVSQQALGMLSQNITAAIERLAGLIDDEDKRLGRMAAKDIVEYHLKLVEFQGLENRLAAIESKLDQR